MSPARRLPSLSARLLDDSRSKHERMLDASPIRQYQSCTFHHPCARSAERVCAAAAVIPRAGREIIDGTSFEAGSALVAVPAIRGTLGKVANCQARCLPPPPPPGGWDRRARLDAGGGVVLPADG